MNYKNVSKNNSVFVHDLKCVRTRNYCNILIMLILSKILFTFFKINYENL